jgi:predicted dehydrogenase
VHICTPNHSHARLAEALVKGNKHVLCEKPLGMNSQETSALVELAEKHQRVGAVSYNLRYYPLAQQMRALIKSGEIGEPRLVHGSYLQDWLFYPTDWNWRLDPQLGGDLRAVADIGTHWLDLASWITGRNVRQVFADLETVLPVRKKPLKKEVETFASKMAESQEYADVPINTEDYASVLLRFEENLKGVMTVSQVSAGRKNRLWIEVDGSEGSVWWDSEEPNSLWLGSRSHNNSLLIKDPALLSKEARPFAAYPGGHAEGYPDTFVQLFKAYYGYLAAGKWHEPRLFPTFLTGHEEVCICEAIAESGRQGIWINVCSDIQLPDRS